MPKDIVQEVFLSLFRHVRPGRSRANLKDWLFRVAHNLALKRPTWTRKRQADMDGHVVVAAHRLEVAASPEEQLADAQRQRRLLAVFNALPERDRRCLSLRAEGLRYRQIAGVLGMSFGPLATAQRDIASNWIAAYKKYFQTDRRLPPSSRRRM
jgi:RNA polymerase sigma-70 factor (ECF subfamily)